MLKPTLIRVGSRILNLDAVRYMEVEGVTGKESDSPTIINVHLRQDWTIQFTEREAEALLAILKDGYMRHINID